MGGGTTAIHIFEYRAFYPMKRIFLLALFIISLFTSPSFGQWNAKLMLHNQITNAIDTVWVGCAENGDWGYQDGLDVIDTTFKPFAIWGDDSIINPSQCFNLKKDIKNFTSGFVHFNLQYIDTTFQDSSDFIKIDTNDFKFDNGDYKLTYATLQVLSGGYLIAIDNIEATIFYGIDTVNYGATFGLDSISLILEPYLGCLQVYDQMTLRLVIGFNYYLSTMITEPSNDSKFRLNPNPASTSIQIHLPSNQQTSLTIFNLLGEKVKEEKVTGRDVTIDVSDLPAGMYVARTKKEVIGKFVKELK